MWKWSNFFHDKNKYLLVIYWRNGDMVQSEKTVVGKSCAVVFRDLLLRVALSGPLYSNEVLMDLKKCFVVFPFMSLY